MALVTTTLSSAVAVGDNVIVVASATTVAAGRLFIIDQEVMQVVQSYVSGTTVGVLRGRDGSVQAAHKASANAVHGLATDFAVPPAGLDNAATYTTVRTCVVSSLSATGAIPLPAAGTDARVILNGTGALAMTLANPTTDMDGVQLTIIGNGKAAHTLTYTAGLGNGGSALDVNTWAAGAQIALTLYAANGIWVPLAVMAGTLTNITVTAA